MSEQNVNFKKTAAAETQYSTGAQRDSRSGKGAFHWMPWDAVWLVSNIYELGNKGRSKTGDGNDRNWENGMPLIDFLHSAMNHITAHIAGDRSEPHISQAIWNLLNYLQTSIWVILGFRPKELNKLPNHRGNWKPGDEPPSPLSTREIEWLQFKAVLPKLETVPLVSTEDGGFRRATPPTGTVEAIANGLAAASKPKPFVEDEDEV